MTAPRRTTAGTTIRGERGAVALLATTLTLALVVFAVLVVTGVARVTTASAQARVAADASALAVLGGSVLTGGLGDPGTAAGEAAAIANHAELIDLDLQGWPIAVTVTVQVPLPWPLDLLRPVRGVASARLHQPEASPHQPEASPRQPEASPRR